MQPPLYRVRNKNETIYAYTDLDKNKAIDSLKGKVEITRFKGLGEISPNEFVNFINENIKLEQVAYKDDVSIEDVLSYYMGKNTQLRQEFIINNLRIEK